MIMMKLCVWKQENSNSKINNIDSPTFQLGLSVKNKEQARANLKCGDRVVISLDVKSKDTKKSGLKNKFSKFGKDVKSERVVKHIGEIKGIKGDYYIIHYENNPFFFNYQNFVKTDPRIDLIETWTPIQAELTRKDGSLWLRFTNNVER